MKVGNFLAIQIWSLNTAIAISNNVSIPNSAYFTRAILTLYSVKADRSFFNNGKFNVWDLSIILQNIYHSANNRGDLWIERSKTLLLYIYKYKPNFWAGKYHIIGVLRAKTAAPSTRGGFSDTLHVR